MSAWKRDDFLATHDDKRAGVCIVVDLRTQRWTITVEAWTMEPHEGELEWCLADLTPDHFTHVAKCLNELGRLLEADRLATPEGKAEAEAKSAAGCAKHRIPYCWRCYPGILPPSMRGMRG